MNRTPGCFPARPPRGTVRRGFKPHTESLEPRRLLAGDLSAWHNAALPMDTNRDGRVTSLDALVAINDLNEHGARPIVPQGAHRGLVDVDGNGLVSPADPLRIINHLNRAAGEDHFQVQFRLAVTSFDSEEPLTDIAPAQDFLLRVYVSDLTDEPGGVFAAYLDITYPPEMAEVNGSLQFSDQWPNQRSGDTSADGIVDESGAFFGGFTGTGATESLVYSIPMSAEAPGTLTFSGNPADNLPAHEVLLFSVNDPVPAEEIAFLGTSVQIRAAAATAVDDTYAATQNEVLRVGVPEGVLANDINPDGVPLAARVVANPASGVLELGSNGAFTYLPEENFAGTDSFRYVVNNGTVDSNEATVTISVDDVNERPVAVDDRFEMLRDTTLTVSAPGVLANDQDPDGDSLVVDLTQTTENGTLRLQPDGAFEYTPIAGFVGEDRFTYRVTDGLLSDSASVTLLVQDIIDNPPVANDETYAVEFETTFVVPADEGVLANDFDPDGDALSAVRFPGPPDLPANGTLELNADGSFVYIPNPGFHGTDSFQYVVQSRDLTSPNVATATLNVQPPVIGEDLVRIRLEATNSSGDVLDTVRAGDAFHLHLYVSDISPLPQAGVFAAYLDVLWDANLAEVSGPLTFSDIYTNGRTGDTTTPGLLDEVGAFDGDQPLGPGERLLVSVPMIAQGSGELTFATDPADDLPFGEVLLFDTLEPISPTRIDYGVTSLTVEARTQPIAVDDAYDVPVGVVEVAAEEGVLANDISVGPAGLLAVLESGPANGSIELQPDGSFRYVANPGFLGQDSFTYRAATVGALSEVATVTLAVGSLEPSDLRGQVYFDTNHNGIRESHELPFGGVRVELSGNDFRGEAVTRAAVTDRNGRYAFTGLIAGTYEVRQVQPEIVVDGKDTAAGLPNELNDQFDLTIAPATSLDGYDFGERGLHPAYFANPFYFSSRRPEGLSVGLRPDGTQAWYSFSSGWENYESALVTLSADRSSITIQATDFTGNVHTASAQVRLGGGVLLTGNPSIGHYIKLTGTSEDFGLNAVGRAAAVDAVFGA